VREDEDIYLLIDENNLEEAVRDLIRIGLDNIKGYVTRAELELHLQDPGSAQTLPTIDVDENSRIVSLSRLWCNGRL